MPTDRESGPAVRGRWRAPSRRTSLLLVAALAALSVASRWIGRPIAGDRPRLAVLVVLDTLRADRLGCYGNGPSPSPNLDAFCAGARVYRRMTAPSVDTVRSHSALFLSLYPTFALQAAQPSQRARFPSLPVVLDRAGVTTAAFAFGPVFDVAALEAFALQERHEKGRDAIAALSTWLEGHRGEASEADDAFVFLHLYDVHEPYYESPALVANDRTMSGRGERTGFQADLKRQGVPALLRAYDEGIAYIDHFLGDLLKSLDELRRERDVMIMITSDHGEAFAEHRGFLGHTRLLYQEIVNVPLMISWGVSGEAGSVDALVSTIDLAPTILDFFAVPPPEHFAGTSLTSPTSAAVEAREYVFAEDRGAVERMIRDRRYKLIYNQETTTSELYDLEAGPLERVELGAEPALRRRLLRSLKGYFANEARRLGLLSEPPLSVEKEARRNMRALGYVE